MSIVNGTVLSQQTQLPSIFWLPSDSMHQTPLKTNIKCNNLLVTMHLYILKHKQMLPFYC